MFVLDAGPQAFLLPTADRAGQINPIINVRITMHLVSIMRAAHLPHLGHFTLPSTKLPRHRFTMIHRNGLDSQAERNPLGKRTEETTEDAGSFYNIVMFYFVYATLAMNESPVPHPILDCPRCSRITHPHPSYLDSENRLGATALIGLLRVESHTAPLGDHDAGVGWGKVTNPRSARNHSPASPAV